MNPKAKSSGCERIGGVNSSDQVGKSPNTYV
jgi:hypothetical protein